MIVSWDVELEFIEVRNSGVAKGMLAICQRCDLLMGRRIRVLVMENLFVNGEGGDNSVEGLL